MHADFHHDSEVILGHCSMQRNNYSIEISQCNFTIWYFIEICTILLSITATQS